MSTIVFIGAPEPQQLSCALERTPNADRVIVVDARPGLDERLKWIHRESNLETFEAAVSISGNDQFLEYNLSAFSSLHRPERLLTLYPGLKIKSQHTVPVITPSALMENLKLDDNQSAVLYINSPGEERLLVDCLAQENALRHFKELNITLYKPEMYSDDHSDIDLEKVVKRENFRAWYQKGADAISDHLHCVIDADLAMIKELQSEISEKNREIDHLAVRLSTEQKSLEQAQAVIQDLKKKLKEQNLENERKVESEFIKAESQLELIKDILLREKLF